MPTYSYACTECGNRFDAVQAFTDDALTTCPQCSGRLRKLYNSVGIVFKGSGFYRTDSREPVKAASDGSANGESSNGSAKTESSTASSSETSGSSSDKSAAKSAEKSGSSSDKSGSSSAKSTAGTSS